MNTRALTRPGDCRSCNDDGLYIYRRSKNAMIKECRTQSSVVVAKNDIQELDLIDDSKVEVKTVPANFFITLVTLKQLKN